MKSLSIVLMSLFLIFAAPSFALAQEARLQQIQDQVYTIVSLLESAYDTSDPESKKEILDKASGLLNVYSKAVAAYLQTKKINYRVVDASPDFIPFMGLVWPAYQIVPVRGSTLNDFASEIHRTISVQVLFDPISTSMAGANGAYWEKTETLYISVASVEQGFPDYVVAHETIHAYFDATRKGRVNYNEKAPVHMTFMSRQPLNPQAKSQAYSQFMSYEEMVTHSYNIHFFARAVLENLVIPGVIGNKAKLEDGVRILLAISENGALAVSKALELLRDARNVKIEKDPDNGLTFLKIAQPDQFEMKLFVPEKQLKKSGFNAADFAKSELNRALALAQFNMNYFADYKNGKSKNVNAEYALKFRGTQRSFYESR